MNGFALPNEGQNIGDHVAPFLSLLSLAPDPTNSCHGLLMPSHEHNGICVDLNKVGNLHHCIGGGSFMWIYFCQSHLGLWLISIIFFGVSL
jgi:hypothetical protein